MASIQEFGGKWRVQVYKNGHRKSAVWDSKRKAQEWAVRTEAQLAQLSPQSEAGLAYWPAVERYLKTISPMKKDGATDWERRRFESWREFFGDDTPLREIDSNRIGEWRDWRMNGGNGKKGVSGSTVQREANLLRNLMLTAKNAWKAVDHHAFEGVRLPDEEDERELIWGWRDIRRVLRYCQASEGEKTRLMGKAFHIALRTALRLKEVFLARLEGQVIVIDDSKMTKKGKLIKIPTTRHGRRVLQRYGRLETEMTPNEASVVFYNACVACGIREPFVDGVTFHDSRATALTHMSRRMPVQVLQKISRHRNINILINRYYRESAEQIAARL